MMLSLILALLLQEGDATNSKDIVVIARPHKCSIAIADHILSNSEFKARAKEWAAGVPVRVVVSREADVHCLTNIMFKLGQHGVTRAVFVDR